MSKSDDKPEETIVYVTNREWESKVSLDQPYLEPPWVQRLPNHEHPHHWAYRSFKAYKSPGSNLSRVDVNMTTFYTPKEKSDKTTTYWVCSKSGGGRTSWWIVTPTQEEQRQLAPVPRHKTFWGFTVEEEFYAVATCHACLWKNIKAQMECENCKIKGKEERKPEVPPKPAGPPAIGSKPTLDKDEVSVCVTHRRWECRVALEKPHLAKDWVLGFEDGNRHHWAFKTFKAWSTPDKGRSKITVDKVEFYAYDEEFADGVLYYICQNDRRWWVVCPTLTDKETYQKEQNLYGWKPIYQFYAKPDREAEAYWTESEDRRRWLCEDCEHINPGYRMECEFCYENRLKESKVGIEYRRFRERAKSPPPVSPPASATSSTDETKPSYVLSAPKKYHLPFQPGTPSKASVLDLLKEKEKATEK